MFVCLFFGMLLDLVLLLFFRDFFIFDRSDSVEFYEVLTHRFGRNIFLDIFFRVRLLHGVVFLLQQTHLGNKLLLPVLLILLYAVAIVLVAD